MTPVEIIEKTVEKILAQNGRAAVILPSGKQDGCHYLDKATGNRCAVGLWMRNPEYYADNAGFIEGLAETKDGKESVDYLLTEEVHGQPVSFWESLQILHDTLSNWQTVDGKLSLTPAGHANMTNLIEKYT